jgi:hypothetical protein
VRPGLLSHGGVLYQRRADLTGEVSKLTPDGLGEALGRVQFEAGGSSIACVASLHGATFFRPLGPVIRAIPGYRPSFRVATVAGETVTEYEAVNNPDALTGGELLDLEGKVTALDIIRRDGTVVATISDPAELAELLGYIRDAPAGVVYLDFRVVAGLTFHLSDGTTSRRGFAPVAGVDMNISVPGAFTAILERYVVFDVVTGEVAASGEP